MLRPIKWCKKHLKNVNHLDVRTHDGYADLSKRQVLKCVTSNQGLRKFSVRFINKAKPRPVSVKKIQEQHQIDLADMKSMNVEYKEKGYR